jgi:putative AdoMet-dependent methyltransferase
MLFDEKKPVGGTFLDLERAQKWDERNAKLENNYMEKAIKISSMLNLTSQSVIVDLGCGTGFFTLELAKYCKQIIAVDISPIMLGLLKNKMNKRSINNIELVNKGILEFLSENGIKADAFILQVSFHHLPDFWKSLAIHHMFRILNENGIVYLSDVIFSFPVSDYIKHFNEMLDFIESKGDEGFTKDANKHLLEEYSTFDWIIEGMFERNGFDLASKTVQSPTYSDYYFKKKNVMKGIKPL